MKIGDRVITHTGYTGTIVTEPKLILGDIHFGIKFDNFEMNKIFNPYYVNKDLLIKI